MCSCLVVLAQLLWVATAGGEQGFTVSVAILQENARSPIRYRVGSRETADLGKLAEWLRAGKKIADELAVSPQGVLHAGPAVTRKSVWDVIRCLRDAGFERVEFYGFPRDEPRLPVLPVPTDEELRDSIKLHLDGEGYLRTEGGVISLADLEAAIVTARRTGARTVSLEVESAAAWGQVQWIVQAIAGQGGHDVVLETVVGGTTIRVPLHIPDAREGIDVISVAAAHGAAQETEDRMHLRVEFTKSGTIRWLLDGARVPRDEARQWLQWARLKSGEALCGQVDADAQLAVGDVLPVLRLLHECSVRRVEISTILSPSPDAYRAKPLPSAR